VTPSHCVPAGQAGGPDRLQALAFAGCPAAVPPARAQAAELLARFGACTCPGQVTYRVLPPAMVNDAISGWLAGQELLPRPVAAALANQLREALAGNPDAQLLIATAPRRRPAPGPGRCPAT
jgi:hypothetical protein